jgi:hypothetical protein
VTLVEEESFRDVWVKDEINGRLVVGGRVPQGAERERGVGVEEIVLTTIRRENGSAREEGRCSGEAQVGGWRPRFGMGTVGLRGVAGLRSERRHNPSLKLTRLRRGCIWGAGQSRRQVSGRFRAKPPRSLAPPLASFALVEVNISSEVES